MKTDFTVYIPSSITAVSPVIQTNYCFSRRQLTVLAARCTIVQSAVFRFACRSSVSLSVTLVDQDHIGWKSWKRIAWTIGATPSHIRSLKPIHVIPGRLEVGGKVACWSTKAAISLKRVEIKQTLPWTAYRNPSLFRAVPSPTPYGILFPKLGVRTPDAKLQSKNSCKRVLIEE